MKIQAWIYSLKHSKGVSYSIVNEPSDNLCIGGYDEKGKYHQYDSQEAYHVHEWAHELGFISNCTEIEIEVPKELL